MNYSVIKLTSNFGPDGPTWWTRRNMRIVFDSGPFTPLCVNLTSSTKRAKMHISLPSERNRATAIGNVYRKFDEIWTFGFCDMRADRQTNRHTESLIAILSPPTRDEVVNIFLDLRLICYSVEIWFLRTCVREYKIFCFTVKLSPSPPSVLGVTASRQPSTPGMEDAGTAD